MDTSNPEENLDQSTMDTSNPQQNGEENLIPSRIWNSDLGLGVDLEALPPAKKAKKPKKKSIPWPLQLRPQDKGANVSFIATGQNV